MKTIVVVIVGLSAALGAVGQTNKTEKTITTNVVTAAEWFRNVNGQVYNIQKSVLWKDFDGDVLELATNGLIVQTFTTEPIYGASTRSVDVHDYMGRVSGRRIVPTKIEVGLKKNPQQKLLLLNFPTNLPSGSGQTISFRAMRIGTTNQSGGNFEIWDYGIPHRVAVVSTNSAKKR